MNPLSSVQLATYERLVDIGSIIDRRAHDQMRRDSDLTGTQYEILIRLRNAGGELRMSDIADKLVHTKSGLTYQVRQLELLGLVHRGRALTDDRVVIAQITESGRQLVRDLHDQRTQFILDTVIEPFTEPELAALHQLLGKLQRHLRGEETGGILPEQAESLARGVPAAT